MPKFYFHLYDDEVVRDEQGEELAGVEEAHRVAVSNAIEMAAASVRSGHLDLRHRIEVEDEQGAIICTVHFRDIVKVVP